ncbi:MAG TPA: MoxR family ATPase [Spirochaetia bacterium]|nr:MoxR family ATPase [Spirochaetia bacterium]
MTEEERVGDFARRVARISDSICRVFVGKRSSVDLLLTGVIAGLHVLIEDVPGVGKTTLAKSLSVSLGLDFSRIQFTPDLLPGDIIGMTVWKPDTQEFVFKSGAIMHQFILADEINRASPRTQSSLLEAMQEQAVTVDGHTYHLPEPFIVIATQNPSTFMGAFQLPEGELDRFGIALSLGYPDPAGEEEILRRFQTETSTPDIRPQISPSELEEIQRLVRTVEISDSVRSFMISVVRKTRETPLIQLGASPRAAVQLQRASQGHAFMSGRHFVMPEDVVALAPSVLAHRVNLSAEARVGATSGAEVIEQLVKECRLPVGI